MKIMKNKKIWKIYLGIVITMIAVSKGGREKQPSK